MYLSQKTKKIIAIIVTTILLVLVAAGIFWDIFFLREKYFPTKYTLELELEPDKARVSVQEKIVYYNQGDSPLSEIWLNFYPNAFNDKSKPLPCCKEELPTAYPYGVNYGKADFQSLTCDNISNWSFDSARNIVIIQLAIALPPSEKVTISATFHLTLPVTTLRYGMNESAIMLANFYLQVPPLSNGKWQIYDYFAIGDPFFNECADYAVSYRLPQGYRAVNSGSYTEYEQNHKTYVFAECKNIRDFSIVLSKVASKKAITFGNLQLSYLYTFDLAPDKTMEQIKSALSTFSTLYGEYGYNTFSVAKIPFVAGGMEFGTMIYISDELAEDMQETVIAHETAHQWWYGMVGTNPIVQPWLDEGLTEFSVYQYYLTNNNIAAATKYIASAQSAYDDYLTAKLASSGQEVDKMQFHFPLDKYSDNFDYTNICYNKSLLLWRDAQNYMTTKKLNKALTTIAKDCRYKVVNSQIVFDYLDKTKSKTSQHLNNWIGKF
ncbi:MAG: M1 family metallopeptidase [Clostridia bacterium]